MSTTDELLDVEQAARRLGVTVRWVRRAIAERRIPFIKVGHYVRVTHHDLDCFIESNRHDSADHWLWHGR